MASATDLALLSDAVHTGRTVEGWKPYGVKIDNPATGLKMQAYQNAVTKEIVIATAGTDELKDWTGPDKDFVFGGYDEQFR